jgi:hybrid cluster-associated redox disulfide protein
MSDENVITKDMTIAEVITLCRDAGEIFERHGMGCFVCMAASAETIEEGALMHDVDIKALLSELNAACEAGE